MKSLQAIEYKRLNRVEASAGAPRILSTFAALSRPFREQKINVPLLRDWLARKGFLRMFGPSQGQFPDQENTALWSTSPSSATVRTPMGLSMLFAFNAFAPSPRKDGNLILRRLNVFTFAARAICLIESNYTIRRSRRKSTLRIDRFDHGRVGGAHVADVRYDPPGRHCVRT